MTGEILGQFLVRTLVIIKPRSVARFVLGTGKDGSEQYHISDYITGLRLVYVHLPQM